jgi:hypothetical protein
MSLDIRVTRSHVIGLRIVCFLRSGASSHGRRTVRVSESLPLIVEVINMTYLRLITSVK